MPAPIASRRSDIVFGFLPCTGFTSSERRPALVLSPDPLNAAGEDLVLAAATSLITDAPDAVLLQ